MYEIAAQVRDWLAEGREVLVGQVVGTRGFAAREPGAATAWTGDRPAVGRLVAGVEARALPGAGLVQVTISDDEAVGAGLACGGEARILVQPARGYPAQLWPRLAEREPLCLVSTVQDGRVTSTELFTPATITAADGVADEVRRLFARGATATAVLEGEDVTVVAVALWPVPTLLVVGEGLIATALRDAAGLLGWRATVTADADGATSAAGTLQRSDAVVVLSHDRRVDGPALSAALSGRAGYVGALGARHTQAARRVWLTEHGVPVAEQDRIHGPAGLDLDAHTPGEIAVSIVAEILASRSAASGRPLRDRPGPVHTAGVHAPPPRT